MESKREIVNKVIAYIEENLEEQLDLDEISRSAGYSKFHLNRMFSEVTGSTIHRYVQSRRLTLAAEKLVGTGLPIAQIACEAGYHSQQAFTLAFRQLYLYPPRVYRERGIFLPKQERWSMALGSRRIAVLGRMGGRAA